MKRKILPVLMLFLISFMLISFNSIQNNNTKIKNELELKVDWNKTIIVSKTTPTLQVVVNSKLRRGCDIHDASFNALKALGAEYVRYVPWFPYPKLVVAELEAPTKKSTSWDFSLIDPMTIDFLDATKGHTIILNFSTIPQWMFKTDKPVTYPANPDSIYWNYSGGTELRDTTFKELCDYYTRFLSWYTKDGFTDENGKYHKSGYHYSIPYWEILNEPEWEHNPSPEYYTKEYDALVSAIRKELPDMKFIGLALAYEGNPKWFEYFLNPKNHKPGIPIDMISYHFYAAGNINQSIDDYQYVYFERADAFINTVGYIENIRKRLSPKTKTDIDEVGTMVSDEMREKPLPDYYWNLAAANFAYLFIELSKIGIDVIGESQLVGYPHQFPDVTMIDWTNGKPNARYWVLKMMIENFKQGDELMETSLLNNNAGDISAQAFKSSNSKKVLMLNKRNRKIAIKLPAEFIGATLSVVDLSSGESEAKQSTINSDKLELNPFAVVVIKLK